DEETDHVSEYSCMKQPSESEIQCNVSKQGTTSTDPFGIYHILNRNNVKEKVTKNVSSKEQTFPPGFTSTSINDKARDEFLNSHQQKSFSHGNSDGMLVERRGNSRPIKIKSGGLILEVMEELVKIRQTMGYNMEGCSKNLETNKKWIREINTKYQVNFAAIQETKLENIDQLMINMLWDNYSYEFSYSPSVGFCGRLLCIWDSRKFVKYNVTISDSFLAIRSTLVSSSTKLLIVSVYAPQDFSERKILWDYIAHMIQSWEGECVILRDFNEEESDSTKKESSITIAGEETGLHVLATAKQVEGSFQVPRPKVSSMMASMDENVEKTSLADQR
nr:RNA-directed DNA polymerase, eukaryota [Tanacetum cinerariifolium]